MPKAVAPAIICVNLNWFCAETINGVIDSGVNPLKASPSATSTFVTPFNLETASDACNLFKTN